MEDSDKFTMEMAAPGMLKEDFKLDLNQNILTISSEKSEESQNKEVQYIKQEFAYQTFQRSFTLPQSVDSKKISATYENGVLEVFIPKKEEAKPKPPKMIEIS